MRIYIEPFNTFSSNKWSVFIPRRKNAKQMECLHTPQKKCETNGVSSYPAEKMRNKWSVFIPRRKNAKLMECLHTPQKKCETNGVSSYPAEKKNAKGIVNELLCFKG